MAHEITMQRMTSPTTIHFSDQKIIEPPDRGDCMIACLATVLGEPYDERFDALREEIDRVVADRGDWLTVLQRFCKGLGVVPVIETSPDDVPRFTLAIAGGPSPRGCRVGHAVVVIDGYRMLHDPHPSRAGLAGPIEYWIWFRGDVIRSEALRPEDRSTAAPEG